MQTKENVFLFDTYQPEIKRKVIRDMLDTLRKKNPELTILSVDDPEFASYGCVHKTVKLPEMKKFLYGVERTEDEYYVPGEPALESLEEAVQFTEDMFGQVPCQIGWYYGNGHKLNALEYHKCSEILYEYESCVVIVGHLWDIKDNEVDTKDLKLFYVPADTCVELYATTLHYAPVTAGKNCVMQIVAQSKGTNTPLLSPAEGNEPENKYLLERNKWVLCHPEAKEALGPKAFVGIKGDNITVIPTEY